MTQNCNSLNVVTTTTAVATVALAIVADVNATDDDVVASATALLYLINTTFCCYTLHMYFVKYKRTQEEENIKFLSRQCII